MDILEFVYGKDFQEKYAKADIQLRELDEKHKDRFEEKDQLSFYYVIHFKPLRLIWLKEGLPDNIKNEIIAVMDNHFVRNK